MSTASTTRIRAAGPSSNAARGDRAGGRTLSIATIDQSGGRGLSWLDHHPRRPREQPQGRRPRHPQAADHGLHGRVGIREVVDRVRHDRGRVAAAAERDDTRHSCRTSCRSYGQPDADVLEDLSAAIIVDQQRIGGNARSTVGTVHRRLHDAARALRRVGTAAAPARATRYSLQRPRGMCPTCEGIGWVAAVDEAGSSTTSKSLSEGAIDFPNFAVDSWYWKVFTDSGFFDPDKPIARLHARAARAAALRARGEGQARPRVQADEHHLRGPDPEAAAALPVQGARQPADAHPHRGRADLDPASRATRATARGSTRPRWRRRSTAAPSPSARRWRRASWRRSSAPSTAPTSRRWWTRSRAGSSTSTGSGSATSASTASPRRSPAASRSGSSSSATSARA